MTEADPYDVPITVDWYCGCFVDKGGHQYFDYDELPECATEFETQDTLGYWLDKQCSAECPSCHAELTQTYDAQGMTPNTPSEL